MIPLYDRTPLRRFPVVNYAVIAACVGVFAWEVSVGASGGEPAYEAMLRRLGVEPFRLLHWSPSSPGLPQPLTIFSAMFLHGDVLHLLGNMLYLWIFGDNVESELGPLRYLGFYVASGIAAAGAQVALAPSSHLPMIGASGAIAGVLGAYFVLYPQSRVRTLLLFGFFARLADVPAWFVLGVWFVLQIASSVVAGDGPGVAWWAHIGGFAFGAGVTLLLRALSR
ncbi:MAG TPA: rhomboid family intramembrane serine protease [bacterium]|nr:rhomboid family intramembrane serine protease [bacterium]